MTYRAIKEVYAFLAEEPEGDGICAVSRGPMLFPLVTGDARHLPRLREDAQLVANTSGARIRLVRMTERVDLDVIEPDRSEMQ